MKTAALFLLVATALVGASAEGTDRCTWGPSYWCRSIKEAKECSAMDHCINHNWAQLAIKKDTDGICELCEKTIEALRDVIITPDFEKDIEEAWAQLCAVIPIASIKQECVTIGDQYLPELLKLIKSALDPQAACTAIGLCQSNMVPAPFFARLGDDCQDCTNFLSDLSRRAKEKGKAQVEEDIKKGCTIAGKYELMCKLIIGQYIDKIYDYLVNKLDAEKICKFGGMC